MGGLPAQRLLGDSAAHLCSPTRRSSCRVLWGSDVRWVRQGRPGLLHSVPLRWAGVHSATRCDGEHSGDRRNRYRVDPDRLLQRLYEPKGIGSEHGEGFVQFRVGGMPERLDVDTLNERLTISGATRMRHAMKPDEAYGVIFNWDGVICDMRYLQRRAWVALAEEERLTFPTIERQLYDIRPERAITEVLQWTRDWSSVQRLAARFGELLAIEFESIESPLPGVRQWLAALHRANVPCAINTRLDRMDVRRALERMELLRFFQAEVSAEDGMETLSQCLLSAAVKLGRPPNACVVFDSCHSGVIAAHNCTMKAVAVSSLQPGYQLQAADLTCTRLSELSVYNVRRLFANRGNEFMDKKTKSMGCGEQRRRVRNALLDPPDS